MAKPVKTGKEKDAIAAKCRIVTQEFRASYPHLFKPVQYKGKGDAKYSITMLFKKSADLSTLKEAIKNAKIAAFGPNKANWPDDLESPVQDGDDPKHAGKEGYAGHWAVKASSIESSKPGVVGPDLEDIVDSSEFYPGCYARAQVFARVWGDEGDRQGVHLILDHVQKTRDGKSLSGKKSASEVFGRVESDEDSNDDSSDDEDDF